MDTWEARLLRFFAEIIQCLTCLFDRSEALHQLPIIEDRHHRAALDLHIIRTLEITVDHPIDNRLELIPVHLRVEQHRTVIAITVVIPIVVHDRMVGPHDVEIHCLVVLRLQETLVKRLLQIGIIHEPIPIIDKGIHAMLQSLVNPTRHHLGVIVMLIAPQRLSRLVMPLETGITLLDHLPLAFTVGP